MKGFLVIGTLLMTTILLTAAAPPPAAATFVDHAKVSEALAKGGTFAKDADYAISGSHRTGPGVVEIHDKETDIMYVIEGEATLVTGGTATGAKVTAPNQSRGTGITGGDTHHLTKGDVIVVPAGMPHWYKEVPKSISYYVVKVVKP